MAMALGTLSPATPSSADLAAQLRDKVRLDIANLMPPDVWQRWLQDAIESFSKPPTKYDYNGRPTSTSGPSPLEAVVHEVLKERLHRDLAALLTTEEFAGTWTDNREIASEFIRKLLVERAGEIMNSWIGEAFQTALRGMQRG